MKPKPKLYDNEINKKIKKIGIYRECKRNIHTIKQKNGTDQIQYVLDCIADWKFKQDKKNYKKEKACKRNIHTIEQQYSENQLQYMRRHVDYYADLLFKQDKKNYKKKVDRKAEYKRTAEIEECYKIWKDQNACDQWDNINSKKEYLGSEKKYKIEARATEGMPKNTGKVILFRGGAIIQYPSMETESNAEGIDDRLRQNVIIAHEAGHLILHINSLLNLDVAELNIENPRQEIQASRCAEWILSGFGKTCEEAKINEPHLNLTPKELYDTITTVTGGSGDHACDYNLHLREHVLGIGTLPYVKRKKIS